MRSAAVLLVIGVLLSGCVSISSATASPVPTPTLAPTITAVPATPQPTATPTETPTSSPTQSPATTPATTPATPPTSAPITQTTKNQLFDDAMDVNNGWGVGPSSGGDASFSSGALVLAPVNPGWLWSSRPTGTQSGTLALTGEFTPASDAAFGLLCDSGDQTLVGGIVSTMDGEWIFVQIDSSGLTVLERSSTNALDIPVGQPTDLAVECGAMTTGELHLEMWLAGAGMVASYQQATGPSSFDHAAAYAESEADGATVSLTHAAAYGVANLNGEPSSGAQDLLLNHVPHDWSSSCFEGPVPGPYGGMAQFRVVCFLGDVGHTGAEIAQYTQYDNTDDMNAAYQSRVAAFPAGSADSCQNGSRETPYHYTGQSVDAGRLLCTDQAVGIRFDWTENSLDILSTLIDFDGSYTDTFADWGNAGPN